MVLEDYEKWVLVRRYKVDIGCDVKRYPRSFGGIGLDNYYGVMKMKILGIFKNGAMLVWDSLSVLFRNVDILIYDSCKNPKTPESSHRVPNLPTY